MFWTAIKPREECAKQWYAPARPGKWNTPACHVPLQSKPLSYMISHLRSFPLFSFSPHRSQWGRVQMVNLTSSQGAGIPTRLSFRLWMRKHPKVHTHTQTHNKEMNKVTKHRQWLLYKESVKQTVIRFLYWIISVVVYEGSRNICGFSFKWVKSHKAVYERLVGGKSWHFYECILVCLNTKHKRF